jgi:hypothetical protein
VVSPQGYFYAHGAASRGKYGGKSFLPPFSSAKERSKFHAGIAKAMAEQWTTYIMNKKDEKRNKENNI